LDQAIRGATVCELGTSFFLEAGAGTGKTRILVDRVVEIIRTGAAEIQELVVITFTEKAAGELRGRIRAAFHQQGTRGSTDEQARFKKALRALDSAHIETIHAFASSILREHPLEARLDPNFQQLDEIGDELDFEERWHDWIWSVGGDSLRAIERCLLLDLPLAKIRDVARRLARHRDIEAVAVAPTAQDPQRILARLHSECDALRSTAELCSDQRDVCGAAYRAISEKLRGITENSPPAALEAALSRLKIEPKRGGSAFWWPSRSERDQVYDGLTMLRDELIEYQRTLRTESLAALVRALTDFVKESAQARLREGKLNFEDLLIEARRLLKESPDVLRSLRRRCRYILVDEFQDTDPIQAEIVFLLAADQDEATAEAIGEWTNVRLSPGKLFLVGDPKQSIYRFRRADISAFLKARAVFARLCAEGHKARVESINQNFRSLPELVDWVNELFQGLVQSDSLYPFAQPAYEPIVAYRERAGAPRVIHLYPKGTLGPKVDDVRREEATAVANLIAEMVRNPAWLVANPTDNAGLRQIGFRDICILVETRTKIEIYTDALISRRIPFILDGGREFFQRQEIRDIAAVLRALDDPSDEVSLVTALKSEAFACSDVELLAYKLKGGRFSILAQAVDGDPVSVALLRLKTLFQEKAHHSLPAFVDRVVRESFLTEARLLNLAQRHRAANLKLVVQRAADFARNEIDSLRPFIRWISERQQEGAQEMESQLSESDDDVVRISTIHGVKGLEFPVVILAKLAGGDAPDRDRTVVDREVGRLEFEVGSNAAPFASPGFPEAWKKEAVYAEAETRRLLYVASTRARDILVIPLYRSHTYPGRHKYLRSIPDRSAVTVDGQRPTFGGARVLIDNEIPDRQVSTEEAPHFPPDLCAQWEVRLRTIREKARRGPYYVVPSGLVADEVKKPRESEPKDRSEDETNPDIEGEEGRALGFSEGPASLTFAGASSGRQRGSLVHELLRRCELDDPEGTSYWAERLCREAGVTGLAAEVELHAKAILKSPFMLRVLQSSRVLREIPVATFDGERFIEGFADLAFEEPDGWVVLDYKTDRLDRGMPSIARGYEPQVDAYRKALSAAGMTVKEAGLWFSETGEVWMVS
jgi:ATP-dependent helicase/nuclease subunit A